jgi:translation initiation factor IF-1
MNIGAHIPSKNAVEEIKLRKGDTFQIFCLQPSDVEKPKTPGKTWIFCKITMGPSMSTLHI